MSWTPSNGPMTSDRQSGDVNAAALDGSHGGPPSGEGSAMETGTATFTKWMVGEGPEMAGIVGGDVGEGAYVGKVLDLRPGDTTVVEATYQFIGSDHDFTALVHVEQTGLRAVISGVVTDGWGKGNPVTGEYTQITCDHDGMSTDCWRGTLELVPITEPVVAARR